MQSCTPSWRNVSWASASAARSSCCGSSPAGHALAQSPQRMHGNSTAPSREPISSRVATRTQFIDLVSPDLVRRQGATCHAAAGDQAQRRAAIAAGRCDERGERSADRGADVARVFDTAAGDGHDARQHGLSTRRPTCDGRRGRHVLADHARVRRQAARRHFDTGDRGDQLTFGALWIHRRDHRERQGIVTQALDRLGHGCNGCGFVILDRDDATRGARGAVAG